jgi:hypothetical protein
VRPGGLAAILLRSAACQTAGVVCACVLIASLHAQNDGLWFQGDAPRHAANGFFFWDLLKAHPNDPVRYTLSYYARYPVINPVAYPPLFYLLEAVVLGGFSAPPQAVRLVVIGFAGLAGFYTLAWGRRWIAPEAGWAGPILLLTPAIVLWANVILLNLPAMALSMACLYHCRRWLETSTRTQLIGSQIAAFAALLTYYPQLSVFGVCLVWTLARTPSRQVFSIRSAWPWAVAIACLLGVVVAATVMLVPFYLWKHTAPSVALLLRIDTWTYYWQALPELQGRALLLTGLAGCAVALCSSRWRVEGAFLASWIMVVMIGFSILPVRDVRYILLVVPALVLAAVLAVVVVFQHFRLGDLWRLAALTLVLGLAWHAARVPVPRVSGFREVVEYLREHAPDEAVLYDGYYDGNFGFYVRALDADFKRRVILGGRLLYSYGSPSSFEWIERSNVTSQEDVASVLRSRCGCRWIAVEIGRRSAWSATQRLLRQAVHNATDFEAMASFPIAAIGVERVELYRLRGPTASAPPAVLRFPAFSDRAFTDVEPITR